AITRSPVAESAVVSPGGKSYCHSERPDAEVATMPVGPTESLSSPGAAWGVRSRHTANAMTIVATIAVRGQYQEGCSSRRSDAASGSRAGASGDLAGGRPGAG